MDLICHTAEKILSSKDTFTPIQHLLVVFLLKETNVSESMMERV